MLAFVYTKEDNREGGLTVGYTSLKEALLSEKLSGSYMAVRKVLLTGKSVSFNHITFKKIKLIHQKYGRTKSN